jgi:Matrixin
MSVRSIHEKAHRISKERPELLKQGQQSSLYNNIKNNRQVDLNIEGGRRTYYVAEGDILLDADQLSLYAVEQTERTEIVGIGAPTSGIIELIGGTDDHGDFIKAASPISYCILRKTMEESDYDFAKKHLTQAAADWEETCNVGFSYRPELDDSEPSIRPDGVTFVVRKIDAHGTFIAASFFPNDPPERRHLFLDPSFFQDTGYDPTGVLRHELGHILGFRHEHISSGAPAICPKEAVDHTIKLTEYDPHSVMHYFCGGVGSKTLHITDKDRRGAVRAYGPPAGSKRKIA